MVGMAAVGHMVESAFTSLCQWGQRALCMLARIYTHRYGWIALPPVPRQPNRRVVFIGVRGRGMRRSGHEQVSIVVATGSGGMDPG